MAGYYGFSMSNNAMDAYENGEMPLSKWSKKAILAAVRDAAPDALPLLSRCPLAVLRAHCLRRSSWHHTSSHYNKTDFFALDEFALEDLTPETVAEWISEHKDAAAAPAAAPSRRHGSIAYIEWAGSRTRPRAIHRFLDGVFIEQKGAFFLVFDASGALILRKKVGSTGTEVKFSEK